MQKTFVDGFRYCLPHYILDTISQFFQLHDGCTCVGIHLIDDRRLGPLCDGFYRKDAAGVEFGKIMVGLVVV